MMCTFLYLIFVQKGAYNPRLQQSRTSAIGQQSQLNGISGIQNDYNRQPSYQSYEHNPVLQSAAKYDDIRIQTHILMHSMCV